MRSRLFGLISIYIGLLIVFTTSAKAEWTPTQPITIVVPAGEAGGAAELAKIIQSIVENNKLSPQPLKIAYMPKDSGAEGFMHVKENVGNSHMLVITLSSIFTTPRNTGANFSYADFTPITLIARDYFILWVRSGTYKTLDELFAAAKQKPGGLKVGGTGSKQEDQLVMTAVEEAANVRFSYKPYAGGGAVAKALASGDVDVTFNNPSEAVKLWEEGKVVPLGLASYKRLTDPKWKDVPTLTEKGYSVEYKMIRAIFAPPKLPNEVQEYYTRLLGKVTQTSEWKTYTRNNALQDWFLTKQLLQALIQYEDLLHGELIKQMNVHLDAAAALAHKSQPVEKGGLVRAK